MLKSYTNRPRRKAWIGAAVGALVGVGSALFGASKQKQAQKQQQFLQRNMEKRNAGLTSAINLTQAYSNSDELDEEFRNRFLSYGGRRKAAWGAEDTSALISGLGSAGQTLASTLAIAQQKAAYANSIKPIVNDNKDDNDAVYDSAARTDFLNNYYRTNALRMGGMGKKLRRI